MDTDTISKKHLKELQKAKIGSFTLGLVVGGVIVAAVKDESSTIKEITSSITKIATSYWGCKFIYEIFS